MAVRSVYASVGSRISVSQLVAITLLTENVASSSSFFCLSSGRINRTGKATFSFNGALLQLHHHESFRNQITWELRASNNV